MFCIFFGCNVVVVGGFVIKIKLFFLCVVFICFFYYYLFFEFFYLCVCIAKEHYALCKIVCVCEMGQNIHFTSMYVCVCDFTKCVVM